MVAAAVVLSATQKLCWIFQLLTLVDLNSADLKDSVELVCNSFSFLIRSFSHGFSVFEMKLLEIMFNAENSILLVICIW